MIKKEVKIVIAVSIIFIILILSSFAYFSYASVKLTLKPEVVITNKLWGQKNFSKGYGTPDIWYEFKDTYSHRYSNKLLTEIIDSMKDQAEDLGENPELLESCLLATGQFEDSEYHKLPCYAEKIRYEYYPDHQGKHFDELEELNDTELGATRTETVWTFIFNWGIPGEWLDHIKYYVISLDDQSILYYQTCC